MRGDAGHAATIIDGGGTASPLFRATFPRGSGSPSGITALSGFTLQNADQALDVTANWGTLDVTVDDCAIQQMSTNGIAANTASFGFAGGVVHLHVSNTSIFGVPDGIDLQATFGTGTFDATDCSFQLCANSGVKVFVGQNPTTLGDQHFTLTRCKFDSNGLAGVSAQATNYGSFTGTLEDCLLAHNGAGLVATAPNGLGNGFSAAFRRCTVADNFGAGVRVIGATQQVVGSASFESTLIDGNSPDVDVSNVTSNAFSQIGGPDPLFVDRLHGVYRLQFGSPCIDAGDPSTPIGTLDLARVARSIDGDLDTHERADVGALEHQALRLVTSGHLGTPLRLESSGETGGTSTVYFTRGAPVSPMTTSFGEFDLNPATFGTLLHTAVAPYPPIGFQRPIPNLPVLVGHTFSFQGLTTSSLAPQGSAYTNVVSVTIVP